MCVVKMLCVMWTNISRSADAPITIWVTPKLNVFHVSNYSHKVTLINSINCILPINYFFILAAIVAECESNRNCAESEACFNGRCINPCNCGPHAECTVKNHYPTCACYPGFSGNPQLGCIQGTNIFITFITIPV